MNINVAAVVNNAVNSSWRTTLCVVESEVPSLAAACAACYSSVSHVNYSKIRVAAVLDELAFLKEINNLRYYM